MEHNIGPFPHSDIGQADGNVGTYSSTTHWFASKIRHCTGKEPPTVCLVLDGMEERRERREGCYQQVEIILTSHASRTSKCGEARWCSDQI